MIKRLLGLALVLAASRVDAQTTYVFAVKTSSAADVTAPTGVANSSPANAATGVSLTPTLTAASASDSTPPILYQWELFTGAVCTGSPSQSLGFTAGTTWAPGTPLTAGTQYAWHNRAEDSVGTPNVSAYSTCTTFTTLSAGSPDLLTEGYDGSNACWNHAGGTPTPPTTCNAPVTSSPSSPDYNVDSGNTFNVAGTANLGTTGFTGSRHLIATFGGTNPGCDLSYTITTTSQIWLRIWFNVNAQALVANSQLQGLVGIFPVTGNGDSTRVGLYYNGTSLQIVTRESSIGNTTGINISTGVNYRLEVRWQDNAGADNFEVRVYDTSGNQVTGSPYVSSTGAWYGTGASSVFVGNTNVFGTITGTSTVYIDNICISSGNWCGP